MSADPSTSKPPPQRIAIVGTTGSGKTTLGEQLAAALGCPFVDIDALNWGPNWTAAPVPVLRERVAAALAGDRWVTAGNYRTIRDIVWGRADTLVWLDYALPLVFWRLFWRTLRRVRGREELWGGNRERWLAQFASRESLFLYALQTHRSRRREFPADLARAEYTHLTALRFRTPAETERWRRAVSRAAERA